MNILCLLVKSLRPRYSDAMVKHNNHVGYLVRRLHQKATGMFADEMSGAGFDLTPSQFAALLEIYNSQDAPVDQARLSDLVGCDRATIGGILDRLERKELISRKIAPGDRRARILVMEEKGRELFEQCSPLVRDLQTRIIENLAPDERGMFVSLMKKALGPEN